MNPYFNLLVANPVIYPPLLLIGNLFVRCNGIKKMLDIRHYFLAWLQHRWRSREGDN
jgi:hypothetical protein